MEDKQNGIQRPKFLHKKDVDSVNMDYCATATSAVLPVIALENRPGSIGSDSVDFYGYTDLEFIAVPVEVASLVSICQNFPFLLFPEDRTQSIRMFNTLPVRWTNLINPQKEFLATCQVGEFCSFQIGISACNGAITDTEIVFSPLVSSNNGPIILASSMTCINTGGIDMNGVPFSINYTISDGMIGALWIIVDLPSSVLYQVC